MSRIQDWGKVFIVILCVIALVWHELEIALYGFAQESAVDAFAASLIASWLTSKFMNWLEE